MLPFTEWSFVTLAATTVIAALLSALAMLVPAGLAGGPAGRRTASLGYFGCIGGAYMAVEIALLPPLGLLLGHPVYAVAATLAAVLVFSGLGSRWSDRLAPSTAWGWLACLAAAAGGWALILLPYVHALAPAPLPVRLVAALATLGPLGFLMGIAFPLGWRTWVGDDRRAAAWAWAANGFASVVGAPLSALLALETGWRVLLLAGALGYAAAAAGLARGGRSGA
jgi:hypothetical protein